MATARSHSVVPNPKISAEVRGSKNAFRPDFDRRSFGKLFLSPNPPKTPAMTSLRVAAHVKEYTESKTSTQFVFMCLGGLSLSSPFQTHPPSASHNHLAFIISPRPRLTGPLRRSHGSSFKSITSQESP